MALDAIKDGKIKRERGRQLLALRRLHLSSVVADGATISAASLKAVLRAIDDHIDYTRIACGCWTAQKGLMTWEAFYRIKEIDTLKRGRTIARENEPVMGVGRYEGARSWHGFLVRFCDTLFLPEKASVVVLR